MLQDFVLIQRKAIEDDFMASFGDLSRPSSWFQLKTCLRNIIIGPREELSFWQVLPTDEVIEGEASYQFFLEIICGLHSSLIGETEILGQFKNAVLKFNFPNSHFGFELKKFFQAMIEDAKKVRTKHLSDLGSQSYGSLLRKEMKKLSQNQVHILGAGHLCEEILPWVSKDETAVHLHARNVKSAQAKFKNSKLEIHQLEQANFDGILVIAAPLKAQEIEALICGSNEIKRIFDLRHDSDHDPVKFKYVTSLSQFMSILNENQEVIQERRRLALAMIAQMAKLRTQTVEHRPFGWEDMTA